MLSYNLSSYNLVFGNLSISNTVGGYNKMNKWWVTVKMIKYNSVHQLNSQITIYYTKIIVTVKSNTWFSSKHAH